TRATPEQLTILEDTFKTNTSPNSKVREALAEKVSMSERSIQIWFQNRRAKMKAVQKRAHLMINQESLNHFMTCMPPSYGNIYPFRMPIHQHPQRIALPNVHASITTVLTSTRVYYSFGL
ncbi:18768_t:CDS:1, partial [Entrophospora sp. SA101]